MWIRATSTNGGGGTVEALVPKMTSNTTPSGYGTCFASSSYSGYYPYFAFDGETNPQGGWSPASGGVGQYCGFQFISPQTVVAVRMKQPSLRISSFRIEGSNNGNNWDNLGDFTVSNNDTMYNLTTSGSYTYYRLYITGTSAAVALAVLQFYGY